MTSGRRSTSSRTTSPRSSSPAGDDGHRRFRPTTSYRTHERARHTLIGTIYRRRAKLQREEERRQSIESLRPPPPSLPPEPSFEELYEWNMAEAELDIEIEEIVYEGAPEPVDEMIEYHRDLYPERYFDRDSLTRRTIGRPAAAWQRYLHYYYRLRYREAA